MIFLAFALIFKEKKYGLCKSGSVTGCSFSGSIVVIVSFVFDYVLFLKSFTPERNIPVLLVSEDQNYLNYIPHHFQCGYLLSEA
jgi:hypothetical protein